MVEIRDSAKLCAVFTAGNLGPGGGDGRGVMCFAS